MLPKLIIPGTVLLLTALNASKTPENKKLIYTKLWRKRKLILLID